MFGPDPIDIADPSPYGPLAYYGHLGIGAVTILTALLALASTKGGLYHRRAGYVYFAGLGIVCMTSAWMLSKVFIGPLFMAVFTAAYAAGGAWLALQKSSRRVTAAEVALSIFELVGLAIFLSIAIPVAMAGEIPPIAPGVIAVIPVILLLGDANWFINRKRRRAMRMRRHVNRMVWAFIVVIRAPLVELAAGGVPISPIVTVIGPLALGVMMLVYFQRRYGGLLIQKPRIAKSRSAAET